MRDPMLDANHESIFRNCRSVSVSVTPLTRRISQSAASSKSSCFSSGISNGSLRNGLTQLSTYASSCAITTSLRFASADAFAIDTACAAHAATPSRVSLSVDANPHPPLASTRTPSPIDSDCASVPTCPFFVVRSRWRRCITRTSAYFAPRSFAVSKQAVARSHIKFPAINLQDFPQKEKWGEAEAPPHPCLYLYFVTSVLLLLHRFLRAFVPR